MSDEEKTPVTKRPSQLEHERSRKDLRESHPEGVPPVDLHDARFDFDRRMVRLVAEATAPIAASVATMGEGIAADRAGVAADRAGVAADRTAARNRHWLARFNLGLALVAILGIGVVRQDAKETTRQIEELRRELGTTRSDLARQIAQNAADLAALRSRVERLEKEIETP